MKTWREAFEKARKKDGDDSEVLAVAPNEAILDVDITAGYGCGPSRNPKVLIWTERRVYFPVSYDGIGWLDSAPRWPQPDGQDHLGGE